MLPKSTTKLLAVVLAEPIGFSHAILNTTVQVSSACSTLYGVLMSLGRLNISVKKVYKVRD